MATIAVLAGSMLCGVPHAAAHTSLLDAVDWRVAFWATGAVILASLSIAVFAFLRDLSLSERQSRHAKRMESVAEGRHWIEAGTKKRVRKATVADVIQHGGGDLSDLRPPRSCVRPAIFAGVAAWAATVWICGAYLSRHGADRTHITATCLATALLSVALLLIVSLIVVLAAKVLDLSWPSEDDLKGSEEGDRIAAWLNDMKGHY